jgi:hypothetical protein
MPNAIEPLYFSFSAFGQERGVAGSLASRLAEAQDFLDHHHRHRPEFKAGFRPAWVYVIEAQGVPLLKIGHSLNARARLRELATHSPVPLRLSATMWGSAIVERALHFAFRDGRSHGEWFSDCEDLRELVRVMGDEETTSGWDTAKYWIPVGDRR